MSYYGDEYETSTILYGGGAYAHEMAVVLDGSTVAQDECMVVHSGLVVARDEQVVVRGVLAVAEGGRVVILPHDMVKEEQTRLRPDTNSAQEVYSVEMVIPVPSAPHLPVVSLVPVGHFP